MTVTVEALTGMNHKLAIFLLSLATLLGLVFTALILHIRAGQAGSGLVLPAVADNLCQDVCSALALLAVSMSIFHGVGHKKLV